MCLFMCACISACACARMYFCVYFYVYGCVLCLCLYCSRCVYAHDLCIYEGHSINEVNFAKEVGNRKHCL